MRKQENYIFYDKEDDKISINDIDIPKPVYFNKANKNFRLNILNNTIEKYCKKCCKWYVVLTFDINSTSFNVDSTNYHYFSENSGFMASCRSCTSNNKSTSIINSTASSTTKTVTRTLNINIPKDIKKYLNDVAFENDESITNLTIRILEEYKANNPI